ncbi:MAG: hypothetical protein HC869_11250 [Rhodospirillales bacterium]|nr:hypothetical protein [Rhodospirillales bacterium]
MSRIDITAGELYLRLGATPRSRSARADKLFRKLRSEEQDALSQAMLKPPRKLQLKPGPTRG